MGLTELIEEFLDKFAIRASSNEDVAITELYVDDHVCITFDGVDYYIKPDNSLFDEDDKLMAEMLFATFAN